MDSTRLDVFAFDPVTLRWAQAELSIGMDWYTRCITGIRVTPVSTKAVDVSAVLYQAFRPRPAGRDWPRHAVWPEHGIPRSVLVDVDAVDGPGLAGPAMVPETLVVDHGKVYVSEYLTSVCRRMGMSIQPARLRTGRDKGPVERFFRTLREDLLQALPGYKGPDIHGRGERPETEAFFYLDELEAIIREWVAVVYHHRPHSGLVDPGVPRPGLCSSAAVASGPRPRRCHHPLTDAPVLTLPPGGALEETQRLIDTALVAPDRMARWPLYGTGGMPLRTALRDLKSLGALVLNHATNTNLRFLAPDEVLERLEQYRTNPLSPRSQRHPDTRRSNVHSYYAPDDAAATAVATAAGLRILCAADIPAAADAARWLTERVASSGRPLYPAGVVSVSGTLSPVLEATLRCSREIQIMPVYRLGHRTAVHSTRPPTNHDSRASMLPAALWPEWALRLSPHHPNGRPMAKRTDELLAVACLLAGNTTSIQAAPRLTGTTVTAHNVSTLLAGLTRRSDCADLLHALILLADHLDQHGAPIDYARRRALFTTQARFIDPRCWSDLQRRLRSTHAPNIAHAQRWIFHTLTRSPPHLAHPALAPVAGAQRQQYQRFRWRILPAEAELLTHTTHALLDEHGIDEPLQWTPQLSARALRHLVLPGPAPDSITVAQLQQAVPMGDFSIAQLAHTQHHHGPRHLPVVPAPRRLEPTPVPPDPVHRQPHRAVAHLVRRRSPVAPGHRRPRRNNPRHRPPRIPQELGPVAPRRVLSGAPSAEVICPCPPAHR